MQRKLFMWAWFALCSVALAAGSDHPVSMRHVTFPSGSDTASGYLYLPGGSGRHAAVVVIQEWWGVNDWVKEQAQRFANEGYVALAVDLYRGKVATDSEMAHELARGLPQDRGVRDLTSAVAWLDQQPDVDPRRIGAIGWCMGGGFAAQLAVADPTLKAVVINYGSLPTDKDALARIHAAVLGNFGGQDRGITPDDVHAFEDAMSALGKPTDLKIYPDAGHAFENPSNTTGYRAAAAADAQKRSHDFLAAELHPLER
ncbi:MAG TPA: dienelactone hydrolase family protein [Acidobacteriaceae bacterium]|nr:dienelactone hydrolase family protein [Acidobacteriaceae bacterium]